MLLTAPGGASFSLTLPDEEATRRLAMDIASALEPGDLITLAPYQRLGLQLAVIVWIFPCRLYRHSGCASEFR